MTVTPQDIELFRTFFPVGEDAKMTKLSQIFDLAETALPDQLAARDKATANAALDRAADAAHGEVFAANESGGAIIRTDGHNKWPPEGDYGMGRSHATAAILALKSTPARYVECVAFNTFSTSSFKERWVASTVEHDIMAQGDTFEEARDRLLLTIERDEQGRTTGPSPVVKTFRAVIAGEKP